MKWIIRTGRARIIAPPEIIWKWVGQPRCWVTWNPKVLDVVPMSLDSPREGWRFRMAYNLRKNPALAEAELIAYEPGRRLVCRTTGGDLKPGGEIIETYLFEPDEDTTVLTHDVDLSRSGMPLFARAAAVLLTGMMNTRGDLGHVINLKQLIEDGMEPPLQG